MTLRTTEEDANGPAAGTDQSDRRGHDARRDAAHLVKRTRSSEDERQVLIALTPQGHALKDKARGVPHSILAASDCSVGELVAMKDEIVALRDRLNAVIGE